MTILTLTKHHGLGNDFLVLLDLDGTTPIDAAMARALCDRHRGVGADGLIRATRAQPGGPTGAVLTFELRNADGSAAEMSGNGMRCLAQAALDAGVVVAGQPFVVDTPAGPRTVTVTPGPSGPNGWSKVEMGRATIDGDADRCNVGHGQLRVDIGNPHLVVVGPDPALVAVEQLGPVLEKGVPGGRNVEFVTLGPGPDEVTMRVWERGVGETLACGTGACAAAVAMFHWGRTGRRVTVHQRGGDAEVEVGPDGDVVLAGPVVRICSCQVEVATDDAPLGMSVVAQ